jgi:hypothetical protein
MSNIIFRFFVRDNSIYSRVPIHFLKIPYEEQYENRDFSRSSNMRVLYRKVPVPNLKDLEKKSTFDLTKLPNKLTIPHSVSENLIELITNDYYPKKNLKIVRIVSPPY